MPHESSQLRRVKNSARSVNRMSGVPHGLEIASLISLFELGYQSWALDQENRKQLLKQSFATRKRLDRFVKINVNFLVGGIEGRRRKVSRPFFIRSTRVLQFCLII